MSQLKGRILHILGGDQIGGCENLSLALARHWAGEGRNQEVVFLSPRTHNISDEFEQAGMVVHQCVLVRGRRLDFIRRFANLCREQNVKHIVTHALGTHFFIALGGFLGGGARTVVLVGNPAPERWRARIATSILAQLARPFVHCEIACSHYVADSMKRYYLLPSRRLRVVQNWSDIEGIRSTCDLERGNQIHALGPVLGMVSRLDPIKDHATVIRAFAVFLRAYPAATLRLIGDGSTRPALERMARDLGIKHAVQFMGIRRDISKQLAQLDMFVYGATRDEGFGIVLIEAMAAGVPILCTDAGPCAEVLDSGKAGLLIPPNDPEAMARAMVDLWRDEARRQTLARAALQLATARYSVAVGAAQIAGILNE